MNKKTYAEDVLPRLSKPIQEHNAESFFDHVVKQYAPRTSGGKIKELKPSGRFINRPTKSDKRPRGTYEIEYQTALGLLNMRIEFNRDMTLVLALSEIAKKLNCNEELLRRFLQIKEFNLQNQK